MSSSRRPWYKWYPKDFTADEKVQCLPPLAELVYRRALDLMWQSNGICLPNAMPLLYQGLGRGMTEDEFVTAWERIMYPDFELFVVSEDGKWVYSQRLRREAGDIESMTSKRQAAGIKGASKRWKGGKKADGKCHDVAMTNACQSNSDTDTDTDTDKKGVTIVTPAVQDAPQAPAACPQKEIIALWKECLPQLKQIKEWNKTNQDHLRARWRSNANYQTIEFWRWLFAEKISGSNFLMGRVKEFQATLDWVVKPTNFSKIINGNFDNCEPPQNRNGPQPQTYAQFQDAERRHQARRALEYLLEERRNEKHNSKRAGLAEFCLPAAQNG